MISCLFPSAAVFWMIEQGKPKISASSWVLSVLIIKSKLTPYLVMKTNGPDSA
jgi:hypothetical protein